MESVFKKSDTNVIKGVAVCLLLWHHLFYNVNVIESSFSSFNISQIISYYSKVCVAIFIILSGYGLAKSYHLNKYSIGIFYKKHFKKLYLNYWIIWLIFIPTGIIFFGRTFRIVYENHIIIKLILNIFGVQKIFSFNGYNETWWFMSLIVGLYAIFPIIYNLMKKHSQLCLILSFLLMFVPQYAFHHIALLFVYGAWTFPFVFGIYLSNNKIIEKCSGILINKRKRKLLIYIFIMAILMLCRKYGIGLKDIRVDTFYGFIIILISYEYLAKVRFLSKFLVILGEHSFNIFLFHTFIFKYYFNTFIYSFKFPIIIFMVLLIICLFISIVIERIKVFIAHGFKQHSLITLKNKTT